MKSDKRWYHYVGAIVIGLLIPVLLIIALWCVENSGLSVDDCYKGIAAGQIVVICPPKESKND